MAELIIIIIIIIITIPSEGDEKRFYRELSRAQLQDKQTEVPKVENIAHCWSGIWGKTKKGNFEATWLKLERHRVYGISEMEVINITASDISRVLKRAQNWKIPGSDMVHNFWYKHLIRAYPVLTK